VSDLGEVLALAADVAAGLVLGVVDQPAGVMVPRRVSLRVWPPAASARLVSQAARTVTYAPYDLNSMSIRPPVSKLTWMRRVQKVVAYIVRDGQLLVFTHADHERFDQAGLQVPAGTVKDRELPEDAVLREAEEETGLKGLRIERYLGAGGLGVVVASATSSWRDWVGCGLVSGWRSAARGRRMPAMVTSFATVVPVGAQAG
jgi:hypothetical protein